jgi:2-polyprenyl-3-methyl-5-hydroxy-6-metoxy-1,4-benzoquinol methylase
MEELGSKVKKPMPTQKPREPQYQIQFDTLARKGPVQLGPTTSHLWRSDPRHLGFLLARYKFCAKMLAGRARVVEVGCGDAFGTRVVLQEVKSVHCVDFDSLFINWAKKRARQEGLRCTFSVLDITKESPKGRFDAAYSLDFIEHISPNLERRCIQNICKALTPHAVCILGTPNITAAPHASKWSAEGHINLKSSDSLRELLSLFFHNVFIFSMNDEVIHTGFYPMAHYLFGLGVGLKS